MFCLSCECNTQPLFNHFNAHRLQTPSLGANDTTGHGIRCLVRNLLQNVACLTHLRTEIDSTIARNGGLENLSLTFINAQMPYLLACIRESLRFDPPIVSFLPRWIDHSEGVEICGRVVPASVEVACSLYVISRNSDIFGEDVHSFRPERYSNADPEWAARAARYDFSFGYGPRHCIGKTLSHLITVKAIIQVGTIVINTASSFQTIRCFGFMR
jgi:cytochrome P450